MSLGSATAASLSDFPSNAISSARAQLTPAQGAIQFPTAEQLLYGMALKFVRYQYDISGTKATLLNNIQGAQIFLPLPLQLVESLGLQYNTQELGVAGQVYQLGWKAGAALGGAMSSKGGFADIANGFSSALNGAVDAGLSASQYVVRGLIGDASRGVGASLDLSLGNVINPYTIATFSNAQTRQHSLTFRLIPQNPEDSKVIQTICDNFKWHSLPDKTGSGGLFLTMPDEVEISYFGTQFLYQFARCVITGVTIDHAGFGQASFFAPDGAPTCVMLTINLEEIEQLNKTSYGTPANIIQAEGVGQGQFSDVVGGSLDSVPSAPSDLNSSATPNYQAGVDSIKLPGSPVQVISPFAGAGSDLGYPGGGL